MRNYSIDNRLLNQEYKLLEELASCMTEDSVACATAESCCDYIGLYSRYLHLLSSALEQYSLYYITGVAAEHKSIREYVESFYTLFPTLEPFYTIDLPEVYMSDFQQRIDSGEFRTHMIVDALEEVIADEIQTLAESLFTEGLVLDDFLLDCPKLVFRLPKKAREAYNDKLKDRAREGIKTITETLPDVKALIDWGDTWWKLQEHVAVERYKHTSTTITIVGID